MQKPKNSENLKNFQKISEIFLKKSENFLKISEIFRKWQKISDLSRTCPGPVPDLSRTCPGPVPTCPGPVPDLSRTCPGPVPELCRTMSLRIFWNFRNFLKISEIFWNFRNFLKFSEIFWNFRNFLNFSELFGFCIFQLRFGNLFLFCRLTMGFRAIWPRYGFGLLECLGLPSFPLLMVTIFCSNFSNMILIWGQTPGSIYETSFTSRNDILNGRCGRLKLGMHCALHCSQQIKTMCCSTSWIMTLFANLYKVVFCCTARIPELIKTDCDRDPETAAMTTMLN